MSLLPLIKRPVATRAVRLVARRLLAMRDALSGELADHLGTAESWVNLEAIPLIRDMRAVINAHIAPISVLAFGADPTGTVDSTAAFRAAQAAAANATGAVNIPPGRYLISDVIESTSHGTHWKGHGPLQTIINFTPLAAASCFRFKLSSAAILSACSVSDLSFESTDTTLAKCAIDAVDVSEFRVNNVRLTAWQGAGCKGISVAGREFIFIRDVTLSCARPLTIARNPNNPNDCFDQCTIMNAYLTATSATEDAVTIEDGVAIGPTTFLNMHVNGGRNGIYWVDSTSTNRSAILRIIGMRFEQTQGFASGGWGVYLSKTPGSQGGAIHIEDWTAGNGNDYGGMFINGGFGFTLTGCEFQGTAGVYGIQLGANMTGSLRDCRFNLNGAQIDFGGSDQTLAVLEANGIDPRTVWLDDSTRAANVKVIRIFNQELSTEVSGNTANNIVRRKVARYTITVVAPGIIAVGAAFSQSYAAAGVVVGDSIAYGYSGNLVSNGVFVQAQVAGADIVVITIPNMSAAPVNLATDITVYVDLLGF